MALVTEFLDPITATFVDFFTSLPLPTIAAAPPPLAFMDSRIFSDKSFADVLLDVGMLIAAYESVISLPEPMTTAPFAFCMRLAVPMI